MPGMNDSGERDSTSMKGSYPGGPGSDAKVGRSIRTGEDVEMSADRARLKGRMHRRRRAWIYTLALALVLGALAGVWAGTNDPAEVAEAGGDSSNSTIESLLEAERMRIIDELWKMERAERAGGR